LWELEEWLDKKYIDLKLNDNNMSAEEKIIFAEIEGIRNAPRKKPEIVEMVDRAEAVATVAAAERAKAAAAAVAEQAASVA